MATYKLHCPEASFRAFAPLIAAEYNDIEVDVSTDLAAASKSPTGKLPLLEVTSKSGATSRIFSSQAIARYIAGIRRDTGLMGNNLAEKASIDSWVDFSAQELELPACIWFYPVAGYMPFSADAYEKAKADLAAGLTVLEKQLTGKTYLVGDQITLADIVVSSTLLYPFKLVCDNSYLKDFDNVQRWFHTVTSQDEFLAVVGKVTMCKTELVAPGGEAAAANNQQPKVQKVSAPVPAPVPVPVSEEETGASRRLVNIWVQPKAGVDAKGLQKKIVETVVSQPEYNIKWDESAEFKNNKIYLSFTINEEADFFEEVMDMIEMMYDEVDGQDIVYQNVME